MFEALTFWHWASLFVLLLIFELMIGAEFMLWLAAAAFLSTIVSWLAPELDWKVQLVLYALFSVLALFGWAKFSRGRNLTPSDQPNLNKRQNQFMGKVYALDEAIVNGKGFIVVNDSRWRVKAEQDAESGAKVKVIDIDGMELIVELV